VVQLGSFMRCVESVLRHSMRAQSDGYELCHMVESLVSFAVEHLELEEVRLWPIFMQTLSIERLSQITGSYGPMRATHVASAARNIALRLGEEEGAPWHVDTGGGKMGRKYSEGFEEVRIGSDSWNEGGYEGVVVEEEYGPSVDGQEAQSRCSTRMGTMGKNPMCPLLMGSRGRPTRADDKRNRLKWMRLLAEQRGGECLSDEYKGLKKKLRWRCANGHEWEAVAENIVKGCWCGACQGQARRLTLEDMHATAKSLGGLCLSPEYLGSSNKLSWQCEQGHVFMLTPNNVRRAEDSSRKASWCPYCRPGRGRKPKDCVAGNSRRQRDVSAGPTLSAYGKLLGRPLGSKNGDKSVLSEVLGKVNICRHKC